MENNNVIKIEIDSTTLKVIKSSDETLKGHFVDRALINLFYNKRKKFKKWSL